MKLPIKIIMIGHIDRIINFELIKKHKSKLFTIEELNRISDLPSSKIDNGYLDIVYSVDEIKDILSNIECNGICIGVMNYKFEDNFYMHRIDNNKICISIADLEQILQRKDILLENFIIKNIYEIFSFYKMFGSTLSGNAYEFVHEDTRGCLFDLNGDKNDIIYNTEKPIICNECLSKINKKAMPDNFIPIIKSELQNINKPLIKTIELFIKKYPLLSIGITIIFSTMINIFSNFIWQKIAGI
jgi:hypothetical protein